MWSDERGSEILTASECRALLAVGHNQHRHGHLGLPSDGAPLVLPMDYGLLGHDIVLRVGVNVLNQMSGRLVAFQVDGSSGPLSGESADGEHAWSVLVRGLARRVDSAPTEAVLPEPNVAFPGSYLVVIRSDVVTGRRLGSGNPAGEG